LINIFRCPPWARSWAALEAADTDWARATAATLRKRSPLMLHVVLEQIRRARSMGLADDLRMERDMVRHCFFLRPGQSETVEGIRALAVDKDHAPKWNPGAHRGRDARDGGAVLRQPLAGARPSAGPFVLIKGPTSASSTSARNATLCALQGQCDSASPAALDQGAVHNPSRREGGPAARVASLFPQSAALQ
jgi:hypothetical protein